MIDLRLGDAFDPVTGLASLTDGSIDVVLTDPPFDGRTHRAARETRDPDGDRQRGGALAFPPFDEAKIRIIAAHFARLARRWIVLFAAERQCETWAGALEAAGARFVRLGVAWRANPAPQLSGDRPAPGVDHLVIAHAASGRMRWSGGGKPGMWRAGAARFDTGRKNVHPTQKSLALMQELVADFTMVDELVLDPFAGSGTTALACKLDGRRFVGWEIDAGHYATAVRRIEGAREQLMFPGAADRSPSSA